MPIENWFATPIYAATASTDSFSKIQEEFAVVVEDLKKNDKFQKNPNWESSTQKITDPTFKENILVDYSLPAFEEELQRHLYQYMFEVNSVWDGIKDFEVIESWLTQTSKGEYAHNHSHGSADIAGAYYVKSNTKDGDLFLNNPNIPLTHSYAFSNLPVTVFHSPQEGKFVLFPGWMEHGVKTNNTDNERISFSFNINFLKTTGSAKKLFKGNV